MGALEVGLQHAKEIPLVSKKFKVRGRLRQRTCIVAKMETGHQLEPMDAMIGTIAILGSGLKQEKTVALDNMILTTNNILHKEFTLVLIQMGFKLQAHSRIDFQILLMIMDLSFQKEETRYLVVHRDLLLNLGVSLLIFQIKVKTPLINPAVALVSRDGVLILALRFK